MGGLFVSKKTLSINAHRQYALRYIDSEALNFYISNYDDALLKLMILSSLLNVKSIFLLPHLFHGINRRTRHVTPNHKGHESHNKGGNYWMYTMKDRRALAEQYKKDHPDYH